MLQRSQRSVVKPKSEPANGAEARPRPKPPAPEGTKAYEKAKRDETEKTARLRALRLAKEAESRGSG